MQVTRYCSKSFSPYTITISIEKPEDEEILKNLSEHQYTIPEILYSRDKYRHTRIQDFLNQLMKALSK